MAFGVVLLDRARVAVPGKLRDLPEPDARLCHPDRRGMTKCVRHDVTAETDWHRGGRNGTRGCEARELGRLNFYFSSPQRQSFVIV